MASRLPASFAAPRIHPEPEHYSSDRLDYIQTDRYAIDHLCSCFDDASRKKLLLLLDEADGFLELDARAPDGKPADQGYRESTRLKALMDRTEWRIKVVFAGLHNVLRTVRSANHPLGHFGQPLQIGPFLPDGRLRTAELLVTQPLRAAGYRFDNENLVTRILAQTEIEDAGSGRDVLGDLPRVVRGVLGDVVEDSAQIALGLMRPIHHRSSSCRRSSSAMVR